MNLFNKIVNNKLWRKIFAWFELAEEQKNAPNDCSSGALSDFGFPIGYFASAFFKGSIDWRKTPPDPATNAHRTPIAEITTSSSTSVNADLLFLHSVFIFQSFLFCFSALPAYIIRFFRKFPFVGLNAETLSARMTSSSGTSAVKTTILMFL